MSEAIKIMAPERLDSNSSPEFEAEVKAVFTQGYSNILFDLSETAYVSSAGLRVFLGTQKKANALGGKLTLTGVRPPIMEIFEVTGFSGTLTII
ncbi:MAG: STAS domain-containing protein [Angelakisella sp.]